MKKTEERIRLDIMLNGPFITGYSIHGIKYSNEYADECVCITHLYYDLKYRYEKTTISSRDMYDCLRKVFKAYSYDISTLDISVVNQEADSSLESIGHTQEYLATQVA